VRFIDYSMMGLVELQEFIDHPHNGAGYETVPVC
jgi:hypothetical protein